VKMSGTVLALGEFSAREGAMGKAGPALQVMIGDRRCLIPLTEDPYPT